MYFYLLCVVGNGSSWRPLEARSTLRKSSSRLSVSHSVFFRCSCLPAYSFACLPVCRACSLTVWLAALVFFLSLALALLFWGLLNTEKLFWGKYCGASDETLIYIASDRSGVREEAYSREAQTRAGWCLCTVIVCACRLRWNDEVPLFAAFRV